MSSSEPSGPADAGCTGEREKPIPGTMPKTGSMRTGAMACCGSGTCGTCTPLPGARKDPVPPKAPHPAQKDPTASKRQGKADCCGKGTCGPC